MLNLNTRLTKNKNVPWRVIEGEAILVDVSKGDVMQLNEAGAFIWEKIEAGRSVGDIVAGVQRDFEVTKETALGDTLQFLEGMVKKGLVEVI